MFRCAVVFRRYEKLDEVTHNLRCYTKDSELLEPAVHNSCAIQRKQRRYLLSRHSNLNIVHLH